MLGDFSPTDLLFIIGIPLAAVSLGVMFGVIIPRVRRRRQRRHGITVAAFVETGLVMPPRPTRPPTPESNPMVRAADWATTPPGTQAASTFAPPAREATGTMGAEWGPAPTSPGAEPPRLRLETALERTQGGSPERPPLRVHRQLDGTLQFLPGRLEIVDGRDLGQEIRFVRQPGQATTDVTFGRQDGTPYRHVQLHEPTVSRMHARMSWDDQEWRITNLSRTNPMSVNGTSLAPDNGTIELKDGDRIEMGEVVFRYRAK
jgi:hypothetical protein